MSTETRDRMALRMQPETKRKIEQWYRADNCKSQNEFVEKAVNFYVDYMETQDSKLLLPMAIQSAIDGRLGMFEDRIAKLLFKLAVEHDMGLSALLDYLHADPDHIKELRADSVKSVRATNGRLTFERKAQEREDEREDEAWQD